MKKTILIYILALFVLLSRVNALNFEQFADFYSVFAPKEEKILLMPDKLRLELSPGDVGSISLTTRPNMREISWTCSPAGVCEIISCDSAGCTLKATADGDALLTVTDTRSNTSARIRVKVASPAVKVSLDAESAELAPGETIVLHASLSPSDSDAEIRWRVSAPEDTVSVSFGGRLCRVKALDSGRATVTAETAGGTSASAVVTVTDDSYNSGLSLAVWLLCLGAAACLIYGCILYRRWRRAKK